MSYYAKVENGYVTKVIVADEEFISGLEGDWVETSYDTRGGINSKGAPLRKNYAGIGYKYDSVRDMFIPPNPYPSWLLDESKGLYKSPKDRPKDDKIYKWDEDKLDWIIMKSNV